MATVTQPGNPLSAANFTESPVNGSTLAAAQEAAFPTVPFVNPPNIPIPGTVTQPGNPLVQRPLGNNSTMILSARGAFYQVPLADNAAGASKSFYAIDGLTINTDEIYDHPGSPILITGIRYRTQDIVSKVPCLNNFKVYYSFGQNFGDIAISGEVLLGPLGNIQTDGVDALLDYFADNRVSVSNQPIVVNIVNQAYYMYLEGIQIMEADANFHILPFALFGTQIDISRTNSTLINPTTIVLSDANLTNGSLATALTVTPSGISSLTATGTGAGAASNASTESPGGGSTLAAAQNAAFSNNAQVPAASQAAGSNPGSLGTAPTLGPAAIVAANAANPTSAQQAYTASLAGQAAAQQRLATAQAINADATQTAYEELKYGGYVSADTQQNLQNSQADINAATQEVTETTTIAQENAANVSAEYAQQGNNGVPINNAGPVTDPNAVIAIYTATGAKPTNDMANYPNLVQTANVADANLARQTYLAGDANNTTAQAAVSDLTATAVAAHAAVTASGTSIVNTYNQGQGAQTGPLVIGPATPATQSRLANITP